MHSLPCVIPIPDGLTELPRHLLQIREPRFNVDTVDVSFQRSMEQTLFSLWLKRSTNRDSCKKIVSWKTVVRWCFGIVCIWKSKKKRALLVIRDLYEFQVQPADIDIIEGTEYVAIVWSNTAPCAW